jgi:hypothetical protein
MQDEEGELAGASYEEKLMTIVDICARANPDLAQRTISRRAIDLAVSIGLADVMLIVWLDSTYFECLVTRQTH